ncbi:MAG: L-asparaginase [Polyangiales bacterium]|jgi:L-asparaginase
MTYRIAMISTGGTIEKTYDEFDGLLVNALSNLDFILAQLVLTGVEIIRVPLMNKDSTEMSDADHELIAKTVEIYVEQHDGVVVVHGTDRLTNTGERIQQRLRVPRVPVVLTGAMRPFQLRNTDAIQNVTEALLAVQIAAPGVYVAMHNRLLPFPGAVKDRRHGTFVMASELENT